MLLALAGILISIQLSAVSVPLAWGVGLLVAVLVASWAGREYARLLGQLEARQAEPAAAEAEAEAEARSDLFSQAAHDLKNPLSAIAGMSGLLLEMRQASPDDPTAQEDVEYLGMIQTSAAHLSAIIEDLRWVERVESVAAVVPSEPCDVPALLEAVLGEQRAQAEGKGIRLELNVGEAFQAQAKADYLKLLFENLLSNALKFSAPDRSVVVELRQLPDGAQWEFSVRDEGPGLSEPEQAQLFQKFKKLSPRPTAEEGSTGLGLYLVQRVAQLHGGQAGCESELERGSRFWVRLPLAGKPVPSTKSIS